jgi:hypothetical protein
MLANVWRMQAMDQRTKATTGQYQARLDRTGVGDNIGRVLVTGPSSFTTECRCIHGISAAK